LPKPTGCV